ncbi:thiopeptide-type bacteriocin biosynthesis protein [Enterococcus casseliflavus]|uniref:thiopeptide-type bacteriocin biosynthesis protein n=2 Tax=Enterococcus casseliflavus TaxID=37734 RepID=UPI00288DB86F|nr:thiopeptide-type bacteriocin biosynthesis protein [Enterococcus casseliflavus]MDT2974919.1 thiopeptide-type bacteriocin biosynthesis protein [Enterococcus casseliflavus]
MKQIFSLSDQYSLRYTSVNTSSNSVEKNALLLREKMPTALNYASFSLFNQLQKIDSHFIDENRKMNHSLIKYRARAKYRVIPYGLFSTVMEGVFSSKDLFNLDKSSEETDLQISNDWLNKIKNELETDPNIIKKISIKKNAFARYRNNYIIIFNQSLQKENEEIIKIEKTDLLQAILTYVDKEFQTVSSLTKLCLNRFPSLNEQEILDYISQLITLKLLVTDIFFSANTSKDKLQELEFLTNGATKKIIEEIIALQKEFNAIKVYDNEEKNRIMTKIIELQRSLCTAKKYIYLNSISHEMYRLSLKDKEDIIEFGNIISLFIKKNNVSNLNMYKNHMNQLVDSSEPVQIIDLLIDTYSKPYQENDVIQYYPNDSSIMLKEKINQVLLDGKEEIILDSLDIENLERKALDKNFFKNITEFEMLISIVINDFGEKVYIYNDGSITNTVGSYMGRFKHIFPEKEILDSNILELSQIPEVDEAADVVYSGEAKYQKLSLENRLSNVALDDLYLIMSNDGTLYLSDKNKQTYLPRQSSMIDPTVCYSRLYNLLFNLQFEHIENITDVLNEMRYNYHFVPRIMYKNYVLMKKHWKIYYSSLKQFEPNTEKFKNYLLKIGCPMLVGVVSNSSTTYFDLLDSDRVYDLFSELKRNGNLLLTESIWEFGKPITNNLNNEFVFSFQNKDTEPKKYYLEKENIISRFETPLFEKNWFTVKVYVNYEFQSDFLKNLSGLWEIHESTGESTHFFIRYADPQPHFRLRFKMSNTDSKCDVVSNIVRYLNSLDYVNNISIERFKPEYYRYGGISLTQKCLSFFAWETNVFNKRYSDINIFQIVAHIYNYLYLCGLGIQDIKIYTSRYKANDKFALVTSDRQTTLMYIDSERKNLKKNYYLNTDLNKVNLHLGSIPDNIIDSLVHMSINRLNGIDRNTELKILRLLYDYSAYNFYISKEKI